MKKVSGSTIGIFALLILVVLGGWFVRNTMEQKRIQAFNAKYAEMSTLFVKQDYSGVIADATEGLSLALNQDSVFSVKYLLASSLFLRNQDNDRQDGLSIFKSIIADTSQSPTIRAGSYNRLLLLVDGLSDAEMRQLVFVGEPYQTYLAQAGGDVQGGLLAMYQASNALAPSATANYQMAKIRAQAILRGTIDRTSSTQQQEATEIKALLDEGDALLTSAIVNSLSYSVAANLYTAKAIALTLLVQFPSTSVSQTDVSAAYEKAILTADKGTDTVSKSEALLGRLFYAIEIGSVGEDATGAQAKKLLIPFGNTTRYPIVDAYLMSVAQRPKTNLAHKQILSLLKTSPEFAAYVSTLALKF